MTTSTDPYAPESSEPHGEDHVHLYPTSGIREGNARLPKWFVVAMLSLFAFFAWYVVTQIDAQPSTARIK
jgi:hypothetical protein